ncbi:MAG: YkgJ family cysteine cluster protein [Myxococcales bacterium]|nr:YkgJ family cysteine cluster protein [Myxococcales bacterium]
MPTLSLETPDGHVRLELALPAAESTLGALAAAFLPLDDAATGLAIARSTREGQPITCREGCAHCCRQLVPLSAPEAFHLAGVVAAHGDRAAIEARFERVRAVLDRSWIGYALRNRMAEDERRAKELALGFFSLQQACPLLVDERCSIYADRPVVCREYVVTTPVEGCTRPGIAPLRRVPLALQLSEALASVAGQRLGAELGRTVPLPLALAFADEHRALAARTFPTDALVADVLAALRV